MKNVFFWALAIVKLDVPKESAASLFRIEKYATKENCKNRKTLAERRVLKTHI
jgi:hypothetical protein